jgi:anti-sigma B factor antagonist
MKRGPIVTSEIFRASVYDDGNGQTRLVLEGELDIATAPVFAEKLTVACSDKPAELIIDLTELTYADSSGVREFVHAAELCARDGTQLRLTGASEIVRRVFELTGVAGMFLLEP